MMFKFHIIGYVGKGDSYWSNRPVDITVFSDNATTAVAKAERVLGKTISTTCRQIIIEELDGKGEGE